MSSRTENDLIVKAVNWTLKSLEAVTSAGGHAGLFAQVPEELLVNLVRNNLVLKHDW